MSIVGTHLFTNAPGKSFLLLDLHEAKPGLVTLQHANGDQCQNCRYGNEYRPLHRLRSLLYRKLLVLFRHGNFVPYPFIKDDIFIEPMMINATVLVIER